MPRVAILLATYNGARFLPEQLDSFLRQEGVEWVLYWRDDGSADGTVSLVEAFAAGPAAGRCVRVAGPDGRAGPTGSFMALLRAADEAGATRGATDGADAVAFADQDDIWLPGKLKRGVDALARNEGAALYCSRQVLVDEASRSMGESGPLRADPFPAALTQNVATGCTVMLNRAGAALVARSSPPSSSLHDWWSYLLVSAHGGALVADAQPTVMYRQHPANVVGAPLSVRRRAVAALLRGPDVFMNVLRGHVAALRAQPELVSGEAMAVLDVIHSGLHGGVRERLRALRLPGLRRQTWHETLLFRWWFLIG